MSDLKSKNPNDYFPAKFEDLRPNTAVTFGICLYFPLNNHVMLWRKPGEQIDFDFLKRYSSLGLVDIWIHRDDAESYENYMNPKKDAAVTTEAYPEKAQAAEETAPPKKKTAEGAFISEVMENKNLEPETKKDILKQVADKVLEEATQAETREEQKQIDQKNKKVVKDVLDTHPSPAKNVIEEVWNLASLDSELEHSVNVATYSVIFAMAFGKLDPDLVTDLALAGLMHDIGLPQVPYSVTSKPLQQLTDADRKHYAVHLDEAIRLINEHAPEITDRSKQILLQHHEQFNGQGYPKKLEGFNFDDVAQIVAMADMVDAMSTGQWDGKERPMRDAILQLEKLEKATSFPVYFNPEVFSSVMRWMKSDRAKTAMKDANQVVDSQVQSVILQDDEKKAS